MTNEYVTGLHVKIKNLKKEISDLNRSSSKKVARIRELEAELEKLHQELDKAYSKSELLKMLAESFLADLKKKKRHNESK